MSKEKATENSGFLDGRDYTAAFLYEFFALLVGNGVYVNELAPTANNENMTITHGSGHAWINGVCYKNTTPFVLDIGTADGALNRYDSLMLRLDLSANETYAVIVQGDYATNPTPPACIRNAETYDLKICDIYIPAGCTKITQAQITDRRLDSSVCGMPVFPVQHIDMTTFYRQIVTDLAEFKQRSQADFNTWVDMQEESHLATMADLVEIVRSTSDSSVSEIMALLQQLNELLDGDTVGELIAAINGKLSKSGDTMTGNLSIPVPVDADHAVNKGYVDTLDVPATLTASGWSGESAPFTQTVQVDGLTDKKRAMVYPVWPEDAEEAEALNDEAAKVRDCKKTGGSITFICWTDKPIMDIPIIVEVYV